MENIRFVFKKDKVWNSIFQNIRNEIEVNLRSYMFSSIAFDIETKTFRVYFVLNDDINNFILPSEALWRK